MTETTTNVLGLRHPELFRLLGDPDNQAPISFGITCDDGWYDLINTLCELIEGQIQQINVRSKVKAPEGTQPPRLELPYFVQVKEKFGGLRVHMAWPKGTKETLDQIKLLLQPNAGSTESVRLYWEPDRMYEVIRGAVAFAEAHSLVTCEKCGSPGCLRRRGGWYFTSCGTCAEPGSVVVDETSDKASEE